MVEIPDENGLSSDSLRGSAHLIQTHLVGANADERRDSYTGQGLTRDNLSKNELVALHSVGVLVDEDAKPLDLENDDIPASVPYAYRPSPVARFAAATPPLSPATAAPVPPSITMTVEEYERLRGDQSGLRFPGQGSVRPDADKPLQNRPEPGPFVGNVTPGNRPEIDQDVPSTRPFGAPENDPDSELTDDQTPPPHPHTVHTHDESSDVG